MTEQYLIRVCIIDERLRAVEPGLILDSVVPEHPINPPTTLTGKYEPARAEMAAKK